jgi:hypothetical protein
MSEYFLRVSSKFNAKRTVQRKAAAAIDVLSGLPTASADALKTMKSSPSWGHLNEIGQR